MIFQDRHRCCFEILNKQNFNIPSTVNYIQKEGKENIFIPDLCASFQEAVVEVLVVKTLRACEKFNIKKVAVAGGVAANTRLREFMLQSCDEKGFRCFFPKVELCTDKVLLKKLIAHFDNNLLALFHPL